MDLPKANSKETLDELVERVKLSQREYQHFSQMQVDAIFRAAAIAAGRAGFDLANMAVSETNIGTLEDKIIKNRFASEYIYNYYKNEKTCGVVDGEDDNGFFNGCILVEPVGIICGIVPTTNPTSTTIFKALISIKTRNGIIFSPHPRAKKCTIAAAKIVLSAAIKAGAPKNIISWIDEPAPDVTSALMSHKDVDLVLATGGAALVKAAYSSGTPAIGVGAGNTPVVIDKSADVQHAVSSIIKSKSFDHGVICASEQAVIVHHKIYDSFISCCIADGGYVVSNREVNSLRNVLFKNGVQNPDIVGKSAAFIAQKASIEISENTKVLFVELDSSKLDGDEFSGEKLSPVLAIYKSNSFTESLCIAERIIEKGGLGHTSCLHINEDMYVERISEFSRRMKTARIIVNSPTAQGGIGGGYNSTLAPSLTLGCGSWGGNSVSENVGPKHLLNRKTIAKFSEKIPGISSSTKLLFQKGSLVTLINEFVEKGVGKVFIVTDKLTLKNNKYFSKFVNRMGASGIDVDVFDSVTSGRVSSAIQVNDVVRKYHNYGPDVIIGIGSDASINTAKMTRFISIYPELFEGEKALHNSDVRAWLSGSFKNGKVVQLVAVSVLSGSGLEVTDHAEIYDEDEGKIFSINDYELMPDTAVCDTSLVYDQNNHLVACCGFEALLNSIGSYLSVKSNEYSKSQSVHSLRLLGRYLPKYSQNNACIEAKECIYNASIMAGKSTNDVSAGLFYSMALMISVQFGLTTGVVSGIVLPNLLVFASGNTCSNYVYRFSDIASCLGLDLNEAKDTVEYVAEWINNLVSEMGLPSSLRQAGVDEEAFLRKIDCLSQSIFECVSSKSSIRKPLLDEVKQLLYFSYYGRSYCEFNYMDANDALVASLLDELENVGEL